MSTEQVIIQGDSFNENEFESIKNLNPSIVFAFGSLKFFESNDMSKLQGYFPGAVVIGCSTAGEISKNGVLDKSLIVTGINFKNPEVEGVSVDFNGLSESQSVGKKLGADLMKREGLSSIFVLGQGVDINGSALIKGIKESVGEKVIITGGLAGDEGNFTKSYTLLNGEVSSNKVVALGIYNHSIKVGYGSRGGWEPFGPTRKVSKAEGNMLYELDGERALDVYKKYLGEHAANLPSSGLMFPLALLNDSQDETGIIRTILGIDEEKGSLFLAGDINEGGLVKLMHSTTEDLVSGAKNAADNSLNTLKQGLSGSSVGILVSCIGRKIVMGDDIDDEIETVQDVFGDTLVSGFYSNGEICPHLENGDSKLHNQTMTITLFSEPN
jgi:hypothetical protein